MGEKERDGGRRNRCDRSCGEGCRESFQDLREKEVICVGSGRRLGYPCDLEIDLCAGRLLALLLPGGGSKLFSFSLSPRPLLRVPVDCICCIGEDLILVKGTGEEYGRHGTKNE